MYKRTHHKCTSRGHKGCVTITTSVAPQRVFFSYDKDKLRDKAFVLDRHSCWQILQHHKVSDCSCAPTISAATRTLHGQAGGWGGGVAASQSGIQRNESMKPSLGSHVCMCPSVRGVPPAPARGTRSPASGPRGRDVWPLSAWCGGALRRRWGGRALQGAHLGGAPVARAAFSHSAQARARETPGGAKKREERSSAVSAS